MLTPDLADKVCLAIAAVVPVWLIARYDRLGMWIGAVVVWVTLLLAGIILNGLDASRDHSVVEGIWLLFGWIGGLIYCFPLLLIRRVIVWLSRRFVRCSDQMSQPLEN